MDVKQKDTLGQRLRNIGENSSLHGVPKIAASKHIAVKILWGILLTGAALVFCLQFRLLVEEYLSYPVKTSLSLKFEALQFPAVTVCNMNPMKFETLQEGGTDITDLTNMLFSESKVSGSSDNDDTYDYNPNIDFNDGDEYELWKYTVLSMLRDKPTKTRKRLGHLLDDFIIHSEYNGVQFQPSLRFTASLNNVYGNCFTIDDLPDAFTSGQKTGLSLVLYLELFSYLELITSAFSAIVVIHEKGTFPLPERNGLVLNPGFETNVGLKLIRNKRLGGMYGSCEDSLEYTIGEKSYKYSVPLCHTLCESDLVSENCGCATLETPADFIPHRTCTKNQTQCVDRNREVLFDALQRCKCPTKCVEDSYVTKIAARKWPIWSYFESMYVSNLCKNSSSFRLSVPCEELDSLRTLPKEAKELMVQNLLKVNIFFEDLNFEEISEEPLYNTIRFLSDIGGMMGFFVGASVLTYVELLQVILALVLYMKQRFWHAGTPAV